MIDPHFKPTRHALELLVERIVWEGSSADVHSYWLLDRSALPGGTWLRNWLAGDCWVDLLAAPDQRGSATVTPVLVAIDRERSFPTRMRAQVTELLGAASVSNTTSLLRSTLKIDELHAALRARTRVQLPMRINAVLRYFDTRTLPVLPRLLTARQYAWMLEAVSEWHYLDRWGQLRQLPAADREAASSQAQSDGLVLDEAQEAMLIADGMTDAIIDLVLSARHEALIHLPPPKQFECIDPLVQQANTFGFEDHADVFAFVGLALSHGGDFHVREPWAERLARFRSGELTADQVFQ